ncbi:MAG: excinuclease ABC subunit UvrA [Bacteroidetes bacterium]|jgi:excinuclease ABC subunit A|nr:excinuclease ABC subunit UvrA [Bacteroidota bacterium]
MPNDSLSVRGARVHNLKNVDVDIPRDALTVITGLSGSGKSSLAFDTIYAEGQRRYVESLSAYARQFLGMMERPDVDHIEGLSPSISIEQKTVSSNPRSTVGTVTEIYDYLRLLFARVGTQFCVECGRPVERQSVDQIIDAVIGLPAGSKVQILAPVVRARKGHYRELFEQIQKDGFVRVRVDGEFREIVKGMKVDRYKVHTIEIVVDRVVLKKNLRSRVADSIELALRLGEGVVVVHDGEQDLLFSQKYACHICSRSYDEPAPNSFSFNTPMGYCPACEGLGERKDFDMRLIIPDERRSINEEAIAPFGKPRPTWMFSQLTSVAKRFGFTFDTPLKKLPPAAREALLNGTKGEKLEVEYAQGSSGRTVVYKHRFDGVMAMLKRYYDETTSNQIRDWVESFMTTTVCGSCHGGRLRPESLAVKLVDASTGAQATIQQVVSLSIADAAGYFRVLALPARQTEIARQILKEITERLDFLLNVGLEYLTLDRSARTLSGGEGQRIRLATQIGTQLVGVLYILDEPSIGLHQRDNVKLIRSLQSLRDLGNTVLVVEHDREMIESADHVIDLGPGAGEHGGRIVLTGPPEAIRRSTLTESLTAQYLRGDRSIPLPERRRTPSGRTLILTGARGNNLQNVTLKLPLGLYVCITGVSGSGKSSLINETLFPILSKAIYQTRVMPLPHDEIEGLDQIDKVIDVDQTPIGRTPRSNPATYTGVFTLIRDLFTQLPEAQIRGYQAGRFSFNVKGGRCENCEGDGVKRIEMNFLPDVYVQCDVCHGKRYNRETLEVHYKGKSIAEVLDMTVEEAIGLFSDLPRIHRHLKTLHDVGLGYIRLGQQATTLSGGEAQRVKLATELTKVGTGRTLYILDEPTTGLHFEDIRMLLDVLNKLVDKGNTVVVIEHNLDVIKTADWIIDLGPEGGVQGGRIVAEGTPEHVAATKGSYTGAFLNQTLAGAAAVQSEVPSPLNKKRRSPGRPSNVGSKKK